MEDLVVLT